MGFLPSTVCSPLKEGCRPSIGHNMMGCFNLFFSDVAGVCFQLANFSGPMNLDPSKAWRHFEDPTNTPAIHTGSFTRNRWGSNDPYLDVRGS